MKRRNGFFSFSIVTVAVLTLSLALTAATLAWQHFQMARTYEETVRLTYLPKAPSVRAGTSCGRTRTLFWRARPWPCPGQKGWLALGTS